MPVGQRLWIECHEGGLQRERLAAIMRHREVQLLEERLMEAGDHGEPYWLLLVEKA